MNYFIIDQINPYTGTFDEHKIVAGANLDTVEAALVYLSNYEPNWQGLGAISEATPHIFDLWLKHGNRKAPFSNSDFAEKLLHLALVGDAAPDPSKARHWITTETGSHILINGNGEVVAGAGGKLAGKKFSIPEGSKDVSKHIETVEKIAQAGYEKHGGDKAEYLRIGRNKGSSAYFAREYEKKGLEGLPEGHLKEALVDKPENAWQETLNQKNALKARIQELQDEEAKRYRQSPEYLNAEKEYIARQEKEALYKQSPEYLKKESDNAKDSFAKEHGNKMLGIVLNNPSLQSMGDAESTLNALKNDLEKNGITDKRKQFAFALDVYQAKNELFYSQNTPPKKNYVDVAREQAQERKTKAIESGDKETINSEIERLQDLATAYEEIGDYDMAAQTKAKLDDFASKYSLAAANGGQNSKQTQRRKATN